MSDVAKPEIQETAQKTSKMIVIDGHSMAFRAFYALPADSFLTASGQYTNAVHGFISMMLTMIREHQPTYIGVAFDLDTPTFRSEQYDEYKAGRNKTPEEFKGQIDLIRKVLEAMNIPTISMDGYEADDIIATLATLGEAADMQVLVVSGDRDAFQLITEKTTVLYPTKGVSQIPPMDAAAIEKKYFVQPNQYSDLAALVGETADNLPGVPGVGPKTAAKWINLYGGLEGILEHVDEIKGKVGDSLRENLDNVKRNRRLNHLLRDLELPVNLESLELEAPNREALEEIFDTLEFNTLRKRVWELFTEEEEEVVEEELPEATILTSASEITDWFKAEGSHVLGLYLVTEAPAASNPGMPDDVFALGLASEDQLSYIKLADLDPDAEAAIASALESVSYKKAVHDYKLAFKQLKERGLTLGGVVDDTMISAYLIQPDRRSHALPDVALHHLKISLDLSESESKGELDLGLDGKDYSASAARAAFVVRQLSLMLAGQVSERNAASLLAELELPLSQVLARMERVGIAIDLPQLEVLEKDFSKVIDDAKSRAFEAIGHEVNLGSPKQLQVVLFDELELPKTKKIKTGYTTDAESLTELYAQTNHPFLGALMEYRDATKLKQTVDGLGKAVADDGRIHTTYAQTIAATGRLSSLNPNLQNIPVRSEEGRRIREIFVAAEGYETLLTADYSQIEMRIMAHLSGDEGLIEAFRSGEDLHRFVGSRVFNVDPQEVTPAMRSKVKAMSYGLAYGLSSFGLSKQLRISVDEARTLQKDYFQRFGGVRDYLRSGVEKARSVGYTETILGRRRYLPDLTSDNRQLREIAERVALNSPIQGSAADVIKLAMLHIQAELDAQNVKSRMLLQVHDELVFEIAPGELEIIREIVETKMGDAVEISVPLEVHIGIGKNWNDAGH
ncbi:DNA polymerase-1 [Neomicrococcus aestuarii]|uniref:DNA polymerase I n=2 Tax=Neomicrococcus aestuarii TaxID=556325 RepID=A0A7W8WYZ8_9MICC|nr:DNA polymerase-1 [Neomicrococcus aestuarii]